MSFNIGRNINKVTSLPRHAEVNGKLCEYEFVRVKQGDALGTYYGLYSKAFMQPMAMR